MDASAAAGGGKKVAEPLHLRIGRKLNQGYISTDSLSRSIFRVPNHLRKVNEAAYEPQAVSIGPYHHGKRSFTDNTRIQMALSKNAT